MRLSSCFVIGLMLAAMVLSGTEIERQWENPIFDTEAAAVTAAMAQLPGLTASSPHAQRMFVDCTLAGNDLPGNHTWTQTKREIIGNFLLTRAVSTDHNNTQRRTIERFRDAIPPQQRIITKRLARFGFPGLDGLVWCKMVENVDAFSGLMPPSSDKMSRVGGVTYYCRFIMLPLSYITVDAIDELRRNAGLNPSVNINDTLQRWQRESFANLISTFRHELVHVLTNSGLGVPTYSNRSRLPTWFHEGTATYLGGDPHAGLSQRYQEYQNLFFYLVQRHGVEKLTLFYTQIFDGQDASTALKNVYQLENSQELFISSGRWHRLTSGFRSTFWIIGLIIITAAFRGKDLPVVGALLILLALSLVISLSFGLAEHLQGLNGSTAVLITKGFMALMAITSAIAGVARTRRHFRSHQES